MGTRKRHLRAIAAGLAASLTMPAVAHAQPGESPRLVTLELASDCIDPAGVVMAPAPRGQPSRPPALRVNVLLPEGYDGQQRYPVLYLLHGLGGAYDYWLEDSFGELSAVVDDLDAIVVMPEAGVAATYANSWNGGARQPCWEDFYQRELIPTIEDRFLVRPGRRWHAIGGFSSGATGAALHAARNPGYFGQLLAFSGVVSTQRPEVEASAPLVMALYAPYAFPSIGSTYWRTAFGDRVAQEFYRAGHNPTVLAPTLAHTRVYVAHGAPTLPTCVDLGRWNVRCLVAEVIAGLTETTIVRAWAEDFVSATTAAGASVTYKPQAGGHWYQYSARFLADAIETWGLFEPVPEQPTSWTYQTVSQSGRMWDLRYEFDQPPSTLEVFTRTETDLRGEGTGIVHLQRSRGCELVATLPFVIELSSPGQCDPPE